MAVACKNWLLSSQLIYILTATHHRASLHVIFWNQVAAKSEGVRPLLQKVVGPDHRPPKVTLLLIPKSHLTLALSVNPKPNPNPNLNINLNEF